MANKKNANSINSLNDIVKELKEFCTLNSYPFFVCVAVPSKNNVEYVSEGIMPATMNIELENDKITHLNSVLYDDIPTIVESDDEIFEMIDWHK